MLDHSQTYFWFVRALMGLKLPDISRLPAEEALSSEQGLRVHGCITQGGASPHMVTPAATRSSTVIVKGTRVNSCCVSFNSLLSAGTADHP